MWRKTSKLDSVPVTSLDIARKRQWPSPITASLIISLESLTTIIGSGVVVLFTIGSPVICWSRLAVVFQESEGVGTYLSV